MDRSQPCAFFQMHTVLLNWKMCTDGLKYRGCDACQSQKWRNGNNLELKKQHAHERRWLVSRCVAAWLCWCSREHRGHERLEWPQEGTARDFIRSDAAAAELATVRRDSDAGIRFGEVEQAGGEVSLTRFQHEQKPSPIILAIETLTTSLSCVMMTSFFWFGDGTPACGLAVPLLSISNSD